MFKFRSIIDCPLLDTEQNPELGGNINGPSLIRVPNWVKKPLGLYYLYFAHHEGEFIRLAYANKLSGPWRIHAPGALHLDDSLFCQHATRPENMHPAIQSMIAEGIDGDYAHIASPDVHVDQVAQQILLYFHGRLKNGTQQTRLAISQDGVNFSVRSELLGLSYFRVFRLHEYYYAISLGAILYQSADGRTGFKRGPRLTEQNYRHGAILNLDNSIHVLWTRAEDCPERLLISQLDTTGSWHDWRLTETAELHRPVTEWEGANEPLVASRYGGLMSRANQLRDPCIFQEDGKIFVLYSVAGEQGLAIGELSW